MKKIKHLILILCVGTFINTYAQTKDKNILKVRYTSGIVSNFMVDALKKKIQDPDELSQMINMMKDYKIYSSFYQDKTTKESVFVLDSIKEVDHLHTTGYTFFTYKDSKGTIYGKETFMGKDINFKDNEKNLKWKITNDQKEINGYQCKKAHLENNPKIIVWFTPEIPVNGGPYIFYGLPGLVLESDSFFQLVTITTISHASKKLFHKKVEEIKGKIDYKTGISFREIFAKKENFQRTLATW